MYWSSAVKTYSVSLCDNPWCGSKGTLRGFGLVSSFSEIFVFRPPQLMGMLSSSSCSKAFPPHISLCCESNTMYWWTAFKKYSVSVFVTIWWCGSKGTLRAFRPFYSFSEIFVFCPLQLMGMLLETGAWKLFRLTYLYFANQILCTDPLLSRSTRFQVPESFSAWHISILRIK